MEEIKQAQAEFLRTKERVTRAIATTREDKLDWSPASTARTPLQIQAHVAMGIQTFSSILDGKPYAFAGILDEEARMRAAERKMTDRKQVTGLFDDNSARYLLWLDSLTPSRLDSNVESPFGTISMRTGIALIAEHLRVHAAQIDYIQTIYGDHDWHVEGMG